MYDAHDISRYVFIHGDPRLQAALGLAEEEYRNSKPRRSGNKPYIEHVLCVARLLDSFGCNSTQIGVGLLHDVVEERVEHYIDEYKNAHGQQPPPHKEVEKRQEEEINRFKVTLAKRLENKCQPSNDWAKESLAKWHDDVCRGVSQLTNGATLYEGKRTWQVDHIEKIDPEFRPVKSIDQAASVIDDIIGCNPHNPDALKRAKGFAMKGLDVSRACRGEDHDNPMHEFYKRIYSYFIKNYDLAQAGDFIAYAARQSKFNVEHTIAAAKAPMRRREVKAEEVIHFYSKHFPNMQKGLARITVSKTEGVVVGFGVIVSPDKADDEKDPANEIAQRLRGTLEEFRNQRVETNSITESDMPKALKKQGLERHTGVDIRDFTLSPPLTMEKFMSLAMKAKAVKKGFFEGDEVERSGLRTSVAR